MKALLALLSQGLSWFLVIGVRCYQWAISPILHTVVPGSGCRFTPSCSQYFIEAVRKYGPLRGALKGVARICRCHPWHPGGHDPP